DDDADREETSTAGADQGATTASVETGAEVVEPDEVGEPNEVGEPDEVGDLQPTFASTTETHDCLACDTATDARWWDREAGGYVCSDCKEW
ncbi:MAG: hypothetical protein ABEH80_01830, partial [Halobaculum sp.]